MTTQQEQKPPFEIKKGHEECFKQHLQEDFLKTLDLMKTQPSFKFFYESVVVPKVKAMEEGTTTTQFVLEILALGFMYNDMYSHFAQLEEMNRLEQTKQLIEKHDVFCYEAKMSDGNKVIVMTNNEATEEEVKQKRLETAPEGLTYAGGFRPLTKEERDQVKKETLDVINDETSPLEVTKEEMN